MDENTARHSQAQLKESLAFTIFFESAVPIIAMEKTIIRNQKTLCQHSGKIAIVVGSWFALLKHSRWCLRIKRNRSLNPFVVTVVEQKLKSNIA